MERPATWKVVTVGVALTGLSAAGAGAAQADSGVAGTAPASVSAASDLHAPLDPFHFTPWIPTPGKWIPPGEMASHPGKVHKEPIEMRPGVVMPDSHYDSPD